MKLCLLATVLAIGCGSSKEPSAGSAAPAARPTITDPIGFCARARMVVVRRKTCFPEDTSLKMAIDSIDDLERGAPADPEGRRHTAAQCAVMLAGFMRAQQPTNCPLDVTDGERKELTAFLAAWYGERTLAPTTGDATNDAALAKLTATRDAACACKDVACARTAVTTLVADLAALPSTMPKVALEVAARIADEGARCKQRLVEQP